MHFQSNSSKNVLKILLISILIVFSYSVSPSSLTINDPTVIGEIISITPNSDSTTSITVKGPKSKDSTFTEAIVIITDKSLIFDKCSNRLEPSNLKQGLPVIVTMHPAVTKSIPPQGIAKSIEVQTCIKPSVKGTITEISKDPTTNSLRITVKGDPNVVAAFNEAIANVTDNTKIYDQYGHILKISDLKKNSYVEVLLDGPITSSIPPQGNAKLIIVHKK